MVGVVEELSPRDFCERWPDEQRDQVQLLDVREPVELAVTSLPGTLNIPMRQVPARLEELDASKPVVVLCHTGRRSRQVAAFLLAHGFEDVYNLAGGIEAWATDIDPDLRRY